MKHDGIVMGELVVTIDEDEQVIPLNIQEVNLEIESDKQIPEL